MNIYDYQNQLLATETTDNEGKCVFNLTTKPFLLVANKNENKGYLRLDDGNALSISMFNVSGNQLTDGLKGFIYTERGVWRPGDTLYPTFILQDELEKFPENHPLIFEVYTPKNQLYLRKVKIILSTAFII